MGHDRGSSHRRTKLVCTIGPASVDRLDALVEAGMDVARINLSHGDPGSHVAAARAVRRAAASAGRPVAILVDLAGPKIRLGAIAGDAAELVAGATFVLTMTDGGQDGDAGPATVSDPELAREVHIGDPIFLADGAVELRVMDIDRAVTTEVVRGGTIRSRAGVVIPADRSSAPALTARDRADLARLPNLDADYVGQSSCAPRTT
jgi:pyruvate kinase